MFVYLKLMIINKKNNLLWIIKNFKIKTIKINKIRNLLFYQLQNKNKKMWYK